mmetsp:Transcript_10972/g.15256  ORF Transcript_10972/g.15256 Transcript_10972/m.15256 type:complete len:96 (+) Transcript_10972:1060-1347(+)
MTSAPRDANATAVAAPIPEPPPVTMTPLPSKVSDPGMAQEEAARKLLQRTELRRRTDKDFANMVLDVNLILFGWIGIYPSCPVFKLLGFYDPGRM